MAESKTTAAIPQAAGRAMSRYAILKSGDIPCNFALRSTVQIPSNKLTANESNVTMKVTSSTRSGIKYQRGPVRKMFKGGIVPELNFQFSAVLPMPVPALTGPLACVKISRMSQAAQAITRPPAEVVRDTPVSQAPNGICYAVSGDMSISSVDLERVVSAVPKAISSALQRKAYYFVPLTVNQGNETVIADRYDVTLSDNAVCHRNLELGNSQCVFISTRLMDDKFSIAFEFYINVGHAFVEQAGISREFSDLVWKQAEAGIRGETSLDAWESRKLATGHGADAEKHKNEYLAAAFSDAISIYLLSLFLDVDYQDLRERDYPLLAPAALAERLRKITEMFPPNPGFEFAVYYRRRS
jgi:hypothetical protein